MVIEVKAKETTQVNTPRKNTEFKEQKMLERNNGIETFGRQKINSDKKLYKVDRLDNNEKAELNNSLDNHSSIHEIQEEQNHSFDMIR
jgi:hypothetical protein